MIDKQEVSSDPSRKIVQRYSCSLDMDNVDVPCFPYGDPNFQNIRDEKLFFVDNTRFIRQLHIGRHKYAIMHRPPRFGKTLFVSTLEAYYDKAICKEKREKLFEGLYISHNPVPGAGEFLVFHLDLSVSVDGDEKRMIANIHDRINGQVNIFTEKYQIETSPDCVQIDENDSLVSLRSMFDYLILNSLPLFVIIDEYDGFINKLLFENPNMYKSQIASRSSVPGFSLLLSFFELLKEVSGRFSSPFRIFAVGLCPLALADASGPNSFEDITHNPLFADMFGFKQDDLKMAFELLIASGKVVSEQVPHLLELMKSYYNGYKFHYRQQIQLYNPTLSLHFLKLCYHGSVEGLMALRLPGPLEIADVIDKIGDDESENDESDTTENFETYLLLDGNVKISENVFNVLANNPLTSGLISLLQRGPVHLKKYLLTKFTMGELFEMSENSQLALISLMFYHGVVTFGDYDNHRLNVQIPNYLARVQFVDCIAKHVKDHLSHFVRTFDPVDLKAVLQSQLSMMGPMDGNFNESTLRAFLLSIFSTLKHRGVRVTDGKFYESDRSKRIDLVVITCNNRSILIETKTIMPHNMVLNGISINPFNNTHFLSVRDKKKVHSYIKNLPFSDVLELQHIFRDETERSIKTEVSDRFKEERESLTKGTLKYYFHEGKEQLVDYGLRYVEKQKRENKFKQPPLLFLVSSVWNLHLEVEKFEFD